MAEKNADALASMLSEEDREGLRQALLAWRDGGTPDPIMPIYLDVDGDGTPDFVRLSGTGELTLVSGVTIEDSVAVPEGEAGE